MTVWKEKYFLKVKLLLDILIYIFILKRVFGFDEEWKYNNLKTHSLNDYKKWIYLTVWTQSLHITLGLQRTLLIPVEIHKGGLYSNTTVNHSISCLYVYSHHHVFMISPEK